MKLTYTHRDNGSPQIQVITEYGFPKYSQPVGYGGIAILTVDKKTYIAIGNYFDGSIALKPGTIYQITEVK